MDVFVSAPVGSSSSVPNGSLHEQKSGTLNSACQACSAGKRKCDGARPCKRCKKLGIPCVDKVRKPRNRIRPSVHELNDHQVGGQKRQADTAADLAVDALRHATPSKLLRPSEGPKSVYEAALRATLQMEQTDSSGSVFAAVPAVAAPEQVPGVWGGTFARWAEAPSAPAAKAASASHSVQHHPIQHGHGVVIAPFASEGTASAPAPTALDSASVPDLDEFMPSSLWKLFRRDGAAQVPPVQHWSTSSVDTARGNTPPTTAGEAGTHGNVPSSKLAALPNVDQASLQSAQGDSGASLVSKAASQSGSVHGWDVGSIASRSAAAASSDATASGITMPGWTLASTLPLPAGTSAHSMLRPRDDDSMEMRAAVARCSVPCFRMTFDHQVAGVDTLPTQSLSGASVTDTVMKWIKGARPQSTFANLEASEMLGLTQADFAACGAGNGNCACATPMTLMHPASVKKLLAQSHSMQTSMVRVLSGASSAADVDKGAFLPQLLSPCGDAAGGSDEGSRQGLAQRRLQVAPLTACPTELAVANGPMVRAPPGGLAHGKAASFKPLDCVTYVGLEWWLPPGWTADTMRRTVREGLTAGKVAQQWPRLRSITCYILESKQASELHSGSSSPGAHSSASGAVSVRTGSDSVQSVRRGTPTAAASSNMYSGAQALVGAAAAAGSSPNLPEVPGDDVRAMGDSLLKELLHAQPGCFEGCWPASTGALSAVLTAYMKSLFVLTRAAGEAVMDL